MVMRLHLYTPHRVGIVFDTCVGKELAPCVLGIVFDTRVSAWRSSMEWLSLFCQVSFSILILVWSIPLRYGFHPSLSGIAFNTYVGRRLPIMCRVSFSIPVLTKSLHLACWVSFSIPVCTKSLHLACWVSFSIPAAIWQHLYRVSLTYSRYHFRYPCLSGAFLRGAVFPLAVGYRFRYLCRRRGYLVW